MKLLTQNCEAGKTLFLLLAAGQPHRFPAWSSAISAFIVSFEGITLFLKMKWNICFYYRRPSPFHCFPL
ncbi:MAG: hypothetical protein E7C36_00690 [Mixta calida]|uniref:hypothetical protein n=1 Tax=Mixta calida TaxID=665913 RepID=UPI0010567ADC|nr:hypothetical protein [Mixta calida]MBS6059034.1 hypothetical protein [Pantoea sp.]MDU2731803.1 hypothetical protein [Mixta calida]MDU4288900.1 hypothetical protein [Mixta calida]MDU4941840.1 hypothetical protein [Mixta calida]MDU5189800.1 hypothetical protein [Mixta calida]